MSPTIAWTRWTTIGLVATLALTAVAQNRLQNMPRYDRYEKMRREIAGSVKRGDLRVAWAADSQSFTFSRDGKTLRYTVATGKTAESEPETGPTGPATGRRGQRGGAPARGRQFGSATSPDEKFTATYRDGNIVLKGPDGEHPLTTEGDPSKRIKYGQASWVYGEELRVREAMWFSPDSTMLAFYRFDETGVQDYFLTLDVSKVQDRLDVEAYPKAGSKNPEVALLVADVATRSLVTIDTNFDTGTPDLGHYVYGVQWSPDGQELLFNRTNRKQNVMEFCAADPKTGKCRVIVRESSPESWTDNSPPITFLDPQPGKPRRFLWTSARNGYYNLYLGDLGGAPLKAVTQNQFDLAGIERVDEKAGVVYYMARDGDTPYKAQLHRVGLDGKGDKRLTDPKFNHSVDLAPDGSTFLDTFESNDVPPSTRICDAAGKELAVLAESDVAQFEALGLQKVESFTYLAADGKTVLYGQLHKPSDFDPSKKYPLIVSLYAGPESGGSLARFSTPNPITEMGFLVASFEGRGTNGRGKAFKDAVYGKLGVVEIDDQAAGVKALRERPYVDGNRVGVYGTSYGGYASTMCLLRHPDVFQAAVASSSVTDWRNYDTIYTERYMGLPSEDENKAGYDEGSAMKYARDLKGHLMLFYGTADNNVHPANTYQLAQALQRAGKSFDMMAGPDMGHSGINQTRMWEFFVDHLILSTSGDDVERLHAAWRKSVSHRRGLAIQKP